MAFRKNKKFIDPRYFMDEKTDIIKEEIEEARLPAWERPVHTPPEEERFTGGSIDIEPLSDEEQEASYDAYYELHSFLLDSDLPGNKPSDKLRHALRWIAKFEKQGMG